MSRITLRTYRCTPRITVGNPSVEHQCGYRSVARGMSAWMVMQLHFLNALLKLLSFFSKLTWGRCSQKPTLLWYCVLSTTGLYRQWFRDGDKIKLALVESTGPGWAHFVPSHFRILSLNFSLGNFSLCKRRLLIPHQYLMNGTSDVRRPWNLRYEGKHFQTPFRVLKSLTQIRGGVSR